MGNIKKGRSGSCGAKSSIMRRNRATAAATTSEMPSTTSGSRGISTGAATTTSEEESSSNSTANNAFGTTPPKKLSATIVGSGTAERTGRNVKMPSTGIRSISQTSNSYLAMMQSSSASTSPAARNSENKHRTKKCGGRQRQNQSGKSCFFGIFNVETGARLFLVFYILINACGVAFGSVATMVWILVPLVVIPLTIYSLVRHRSKYLYPFLVISVIHSLVSLLMVLIVGCFSLICFDQLKAHFAKSLAFQSGSFSSASFTILCCALTMTLSLGLALFFSWQSLVLFSCITHFDTIAQEQLLEKQQCQRQLGNKESKVFLQQQQHSMVSGPLKLQRPTTAMTFTRQTDVLFSHCQNVEEIQQQQQQRIVGDK